MVHGHLGKARSRRRVLRIWTIVLFAAFSTNACGARYLRSATLPSEPLPLTLDYSQAPGGWFGRWSSERTMPDVANCLQAARPNVLFVHLSVDAAGHRGDGTGHGSKDPRDVTIPWIAWGQGVRQSVLDQPAVRTMDTAATVLWLLGLTEQSDWVGEAVIRAYNPGPVRVAAGVESEEIERATN